MEVYRPNGAVEGLEPLPPLVESYPKMEILAGDPRQSGRLDVASDDGTVYAGVWECTKGSFRIEYPFTELATILAGRIVVTHETGERHELSAGDSFLVHQGETVTWDVVEDMRKSYFLIVASAVPAG